MSYVPGRQCHMYGIGRLQVALNWTWQPPPMPPQQLCKSTPSFDRKVVYSHMVYLFETDTATRYACISAGFYDQARISMILASQAGHVAICAPIHDRLNVAPSLSDAMPWRERNRPASRGPVGICSSNEDGIQTELEDVLGSGC
jgi:hypothetical protein